MKKLTLLTALALATAAVTTHASAQDVTSTAGDLILGFNVQAGGTNAGVYDLEVNLGPLSEFTTTASLTLSTTGTGTALTPLSDLDLTGTYGSSWNASNSGLTWGILGAGPSATEAFYAGTNGAQANTSGEQTPSGDGDSIANQLGSTGTTSHSAFAGVVGTSTSPASSIADSFGSLANYGAGNLEYGFFTTLGVTEVNGGDGNAVGSLTLYSYAAYANQSHPPVHYGTPTGTELGVFALSQNGTLTYTGVAAPEPSTWALMAGAMGFLFLAVRNRRSMIG
jgi:hypothetical protein